MSSNAFEDSAQVRHVRMVKPGQRGLGHCAPAGKSAPEVVQLVTSVRALLADLFTRLF